MRYAILLILALVSGGIGYFFRDAGYWLVNNLAGNLSAGFLGSVAILFFIERSIERKRQQERDRLSVLALRQIRSSLQGIVDLFSDMLKASTQAAVTSLPESLHELFSPCSTTNLDWLDLNGPTGNVESTDWKAQVETVLTTVRDQLIATLDRYLPFLDIKLVEAIDSVTTDCFFNYLLKMRRATDGLNKIGVRGGATLYGTKEVRAEFFARLLAAVKQLELAGGKAPTVPTSLVRQDMMPKAGQARLKSLPRYPALFGHGDPPVGGPEGFDHPSPST